MLMTKDRRFYRTFRSLWSVLVLYQVVTLLVNLADNVMIGSYREDSLAGVAAVGQIHFVFSQLIMGGGEALVALCSQWWGKSETAPIRRLTSVAVCAGVGFSLLLMGAAWLFPYQMVGIFTTAPEVIEEGVAYLSILKFSFPFFALTALLLASMRSVETVKVAFRASLITLCVNCSLNFLLIHGRLGAPELGVRGAAIGTLTARLFECLFVVLYVLRRDEKLRIRLKDLITPRKEELKAYLKVCWRFVLVSGMFGVSTALQTVILGHMTKSAIAANSAANALFQLLKVLAIGASSASAVIIGKTVGESRTREECLPRIREYAKTLQVLYLSIGAVISLSLFLLRTPILSLYSSLSEEAYRLANSFLLVLCVTGFGTAYQMPTITGIIRGGGDSTFVLVNDLISIWGIVLPLSALAAFVFGWSPVAVILCLNLDQIFKCGAAAIKVNRYRWIRKLTSEEA